MTTNYRGNPNVYEVLKLISSIEGNYLILEDTKKIISNLSITQNNLRSNLLLLSKNTFSEVEKNFFLKLIDVLDGEEQPYAFDDGHIRYITTGIYYRR